MVPRPAGLVAIPSRSPIEEESAMPRRFVVPALSAVTLFAVLPSAGAAPGSSPMTPDSQYLNPGDVRKFTIGYVGHVKDVPAGTKELRVWLPVPQDSTVQTITD